MILDREEGKENERETSMSDRNIDWLSPICIPTGDQTSNLSVYEMMLQPPEPPSQSQAFSFHQYFEFSNEALSMQNVRGKISIFCEVEYKVVVQPVPDFTVKLLIHCNDELRHPEANRK